MLKNGEKYENESDESFNIRKKISLYMTKKIEPIFIDKYEKRGHFDREIYFDELKSDTLEMIYSLYTFKDRKVKSIFFEIYYSLLEKTFLIRFNNYKEQIEFKDEIDLEKTFNSLRIEVKKYFISEMYNK
jgi:hypothetical protein